MSNSIRELGSIGIDRPIDPSSWNWNKFDSGLRDLGDLLYLMNGESALKKTVRPAPTPRVYASTGITQR